MLSVNIKQNKEIKGIEIGNENDLEIKVVQLADDTTLLVKDETSVLKALETISTFSDVSGVRLNKNKTEGIWLSQREPVIDPNVITWSTRPVKSLGIFFGKDIEECNRLNWSNRLKKNGISIEWVEGKKFDLLWESTSHQNFWYFTTIILCKFYSCIRLCNKGSKQNAFPIYLEFKKRKS